MDTITALLSTKLELLPKTSQLVPQLEAELIAIHNEPLLKPRYMYRAYKKYRLAQVKNLLKQLVVINRNDQAAINKLLQSHQRMFDIL